MPPSARSKAGKTSSKKKSSPLPGAAAASAPPSSGFLLTCDPPTKQFIIHLNDNKIPDKKFIVEDLDPTHLLIRGEVKDEILRKVEEWMDENVFSNVERVGENFET